MIQTATLDRGHQVFISFLREQESLDSTERAVKRCFCCCHLTAVHGGLEQYAGCENKGLVGVKGDRAKELRVMWVCQREFIGCHSGVIGV